MSLTQQPEAAPSFRGTVREAVEAIAEALSYQDPADIMLRTALWEEIIASQAQHGIEQQRSMVAAGLGLLNDGRWFRTPRHHPAVRGADGARALVIRVDVEAEDTVTCVIT